MNLSRICQSVILVLVVLLSCIDEYPLKFPEPEPELVVDALIIRDKSFVQLSWTFAAGEGCVHPDWGYPIACPLPDPGTGPYLVTGTITIEEESGEVHTRDVLMQDRSNSVTFSFPNINGSLGEAFTLTIDIHYAGNTTRYTSQTRMLRTPPVRLVGYELREGDEGKDDSYVPLISFIEPQYEKNYYLFQLCGSDVNDPCNGNSRVWPFSILSDDLLPEYVSRLSIDDGATVAKGVQFYPQDATVKMYSIDKPAYEFYKSLLIQFDNDGGTFSPSPAMYRGNIKGGAIGLFRALDLSWAQSG